MWVLIILVLFKVLEVRNARVLVLKDRVHNASGLISVRLAGSGSAIQDANRNMAKLEQSVREANRNMDELRDRKASQERAATATDIGVHVFFNMHALQANVLLARYSHPWGLENRECYDSDKSPSAVLGLQDNIRDLQQNISQMNTRLSEASQNINDLKIEEQILERRHVSQKAALEQIPSIERSTEGILARIDTLTRSLVVLKNVAAQMCSRAGQLNNDAIRAAHLSFLKEEFANAILDICLLGVIDQTRMSEVKKITTELTSEYSSNGIPQNLQEKVDAIARKIKSITISSPPC
jgi:phage shock protein A